MPLVALSHRLDTAPRLNAARPFRSLAVYAMAQHLPNQQPPALPLTLILSERRADSSFVGSYCPVGDSPSFNSGLAVYFAPQFRLRRLKASDEDGSWT